MVGWEYCGQCELTVLARLPPLSSLYIDMQSRGEQRRRYLTNYPAQLDHRTTGPRKYYKLIFVRRRGVAGGERGEGGL